MESGRRENYLFKFERLVSESSSHTKSDFFEVAKTAMCRNVSLNRLANIPLFKICYINFR